MHRLGETCTKENTMSELYKIVRFYKDKPVRTHGQHIIKENLTLEEAQAHCNDPTTCGEDWFDGYREMEPKPKSGYGYQSISEACRLLLTKEDVCHRVRIYDN